MNINKIKPNPNNPRIIKDDKFRKLVESIKTFPEMLEKRPIVVNSDMIVLGGNMRLKACKEAGLKDVPVMVADWTEEQQREFIIKDNVGFGEWDWDELANTWDNKELSDWGLEVWQSEDINLDDFFEDSDETTDPKNKIVLEYSEEDFEKITEKFNSMDGSKENIVWQLLGL